MIQLNLIKFRFLLISFLLLLNHLSIGQIKIPEKPSFIPPIIDSTKTLNATEITTLFNKLKVYSNSTSTEIFVMIVPTTQGEDIARYATDLGQKWKIGQKGVDNGIIFLIAKDDRKMTIQTGYGTEHLLTDALSRRIIEQIVKPSFKENNYYKGIDDGTNAIFKVLKGEFKNNKQPTDNNFPGILVLLIIFIIIVIIASKNKGGNSGNNSGGPSLMDIIILSSLGRSSGGGGFGGGFGGSSGGDFGGFGGGGSFGGGGASGSW